MTLEIPSLTVTFSAMWVPFLMTALGLLGAIMSNNGKNGGWEFWMGWWLASILSSIFIGFVVLA